MAWIISALTSVAIVVLLKELLRAKSALKKYQPLIDIDAEILRKKTELEVSRSTLEKTEASLATLSAQLKVFTDDHDLISAGFYKTKYPFNDSKKYAERLDQIRDAQKEMIKQKTAILCSREWTIDGNRAEGKKMIDRIIRLGLSAFNVQCDNEILSVRFDNIDKSESKLNKIRENVNKLLEPNACHITGEFFDLKLQELHLAYEYEEQLHKEKEEQRHLREQMKEEERARREAERAQLEAEREENRYRDALEKARSELAKKSSEERQAYSSKIAELEEQLRLAHEKRERAKSLAEQTKRGFVYIISNIGSFGENVYKIGMTRRLDPMDRIWELSDASVPFDFDVHALIQSEDAPSLERKLHEQFNERRVNKVNERKEFFSVRLEDIAEFCRNNHRSEFRLTLIAEAKEYRQTAALMNNDKIAA